MDPNSERPFESITVCARKKRGAIIWVRLHFYTTISARREDASFMHCLSFRRAFTRNSSCPFPNRRPTGFCLPQGLWHSHRACHVRAKSLVSCFGSQGNVRENRHAFDLFRGLPFGVPLHANNSPTPTINTHARVGHSWVTSRMHFSGRWAYTNRVNPGCSRRGLCIKRSDIKHSKSMLGH